MSRHVEASLSSLTVVHVSDQSCCPPRNLNNKSTSDSSSEDEEPGSRLEDLFEGSESDDDAAPAAPAPQEEDDGGVTVANLVRTTPLDAEAVPETAAVEPDGHVNSDGILYREPRRPFTVHRHDVWRAEERVHSHRR